jgi:5-methylcytosine-specific restriction endonuclease McrA
MNRNQIILKNLPLIYIREIARNKNIKYINFDGFNIFTGNDNYNVLSKYNFTCAMCGKKATYCNLEYNIRYKYHFNAYTEDGEMLTKDHIYPKSKGGLNQLINYQLLCYSCNQKKKDNSPMTLVTALREGYATKKSVEQAVKQGRPKALVNV